LTKRQSLFFYLYSNAPIPNILQIVILIKKTYITINSTNFLLFDFKVW